MKKYYLVIFLIVSVISTNTWAGGKGVVPVANPVEPIPEINTLSPIYLGLGILWGRYSGACGQAGPDCKYEDATYGALLRAGYDFNQYFGLEGRLLGTFLKADPLGGEELRHIGLYAKPMYPLGEDLNIYGLLGYGWTQTKAGKFLTVVDEGGFSAGLGLEYDLSDAQDDRDEDTAYDRDFDGHADQERGWGLFLDYQRLLIKSDVPDLDTISAGVTYDF